MADVLTPEQRRFNMSRIKGANTKPEKLLRSALHARGLRFRLHRRDLPGRPDIVFVRWRVALFVHGCFWHQHDCSYSTLPATRETFWKEKLAGNAQRDERALQQLKQAGWRVAVVWECALRGSGRQPESALAGAIESFVKRDKSQFMDLRAVPAQRKRIQRS
jgi:DNA mismatch endonuclease, patch repair protein